MLAECDTGWGDKYRPFLIPRRKLTLNKIYWICDVDIASRDNVSKYNPTFKGRILIDGAYRVFTTKKKAIEFSAELYENEIKFYLKVGFSLHN